MKKICSRCKKGLYIESFTKKRNGEYSAYCIKCLERTRENCKKYYLKNIEKSRKRASEYYLNNLERLREYGKKYGKNNREKRRENMRLWRQKNREKVNTYSNKKSKTLEYKKVRNERLSFRHKNDIQYKLRKTLRIRFKQALKKEDKTNSVIELIGCSIVELKNHLQSLFEPNMTWENHGLKGWHIDHIIPCAAFDLTNPEEQRKCFHYTNLQPLWWKDNLNKSAKFAT